MIARKSLLNFANTIAGGLLGLVALLAIGRFLGDDILGQVAYPLAILGMLYYVTDMGFGQAHEKRVSEGQDEGDCFATFLAFKLVTTTVFVLAGIGLYWIQYGVRGVGFQNISVTAYFLLIGYFAFLALRTTFHSTFQARTEAAKAQTVLLTDTIVRVALTVLVALVYGAVHGGTGPLAGYVTADNPVIRLVAHYPAGALAATYFGGITLSLLLAFGTWRRTGVSLGRFRWDILRGYWVFALPLFIFGIINTLSGQVDRATIGYFYADSQVGHYDIPRRFTQLIEAIPLAVTVILFPSISALDASGDRERIREKMGQSLRYLSMIMFPIVVFTVLFPDRILIIFGGDFLPGTVALAFLVAWAYVLGLARPYFSLVAGMGRSDLVARAGIAMAVSNVILNILLIPGEIESLGIRFAGLGVTGAAVATFISGCLGLALLWFTSRSLVGAISVPGLARHVVAGLVMGAALNAIDRIPALSLTRWYDFLWYPLVGATLYFAVLGVLREFTRGDLDFFLRTTNVKEMLRYIRSELR